MYVCAANGSVADWSIVGLTVVLVAVTAFYAFLTHRISKSAAASAEAAQQSAEAAQQSAVAALRSAEVAELSQLAQVMPLVFGHQVRNMGTEPAEVVLFGFGNWPAFAVQVGISQLSTDMIGEVGPLSHVMTDPDGQAYRVEYPPDFEINENLPYRVVVTYYDAVGTGYRTTRGSFLRGQSLANIERKLEDGTWVDLVRTFRES